MYDNDEKKNSEQNASEKHQKNITHDTFQYNQFINKLQYHNSHLKDYNLYIMVK